MRTKLVNQISIKWKIFLFLLGFCALLLIFLWFFQVIFLDSFYKGIKIKEIKSVASYIEKNIDNEDIYGLLDKISINYDVCVELILVDGTILHTTSAFKNCIIHRLPTYNKMVIFSNAYNNNGEYLEYFFREVFNYDNRFNRTDSNTIIYAKIMPGDYSNIGILIDASILPVDSTVYTLRVQLYFVTIIMIALSIVLAFLIARKVSKPIEDINESAKKLALGDYFIEFNGDGYKEIAELSYTLNFASKELSKVEKLRRELIANVSHDLRTPLTLISGYAEIMRDLPDENNPENAQVIIDETRRLTSLVNDVLDISRLNSGKQSLNLQEYNLGDSIKKIVEPLNELIKSDGYHIHFNVISGINVYADESKISQALYNLLINAVNYTGDSKKVCLKQTLTEDSVKIEVEDFGDGIDSESLPFIWDRYYKSDNAHKRSITGTGLGLSIVRQILDMHGFEYGVSSITGKGSIFWFNIKI